MSKQLRFRLARRGGFSLIEVMIGMVILMIALAAAAALSINNARLVARNQFTAQAASLAEWKMEQLRNTTYANIVDGADANTIAADGTSPGQFTRSWTAFNNAGFKRVLVTVQWSQFGATQRYVISGDIGAPLP
jgi:Tfp pilus assembly protein PilV